MRSLCCCCDADDGLGDLAGLDAAGADADALVCAVHHCLDGLKIRVPATLGDVVRVRDVVAELRTFTAILTNLCHDYAPNAVGRGCSRSGSAIRVQDGAARFGADG